MTTQPLDYDRLLPLDGIAETEPPPPELTIRVHGKPVPQGSMTPYTRGGKPYCKPDNEADLKPWRATVHAATVNAIRARAEHWYRHDGPVTVHIAFFFDRPSSAQRRPKPYKRPDLDKLTRAILDGITTGGALFDDSRVCRLSASKDYADGRAAGVVIVVRNGVNAGADLRETCDNRDGPGGAGNTDRGLTRPTRSNEKEGL